MATEQGLGLTRAQFLILTLGSVAAASVACASPKDPDKIAPFLTDRDLTVMDQWAFFSSNYGTGYLVGILDSIQKKWQLGEGKVEAVSSDNHFIRVAYNQPQEDLETALSRTSASVGIEAVGKDSFWRFNLEGHLNPNIRRDHSQDIQQLVIKAEAASVRAVQVGLIGLFAGRDIDLYRPIESSVARSPMSPQDIQQLITASIDYLQENQAPKIGVIRRAMLAFPKLDRDVKGQPIIGRETSRGTARNVVYVNNKPIIDNGGLALAVETLRPVISEFNDLDNIGLSTKYRSHQAFPDWESFSTRYKGLEAAS